MFIETQLAYVSRAEDSLKTALAILMDAVFYKNENEARDKAFDVEKKIQEALDHLKSVREIDVEKEIQKAREYGEKSNQSSIKR